MSTDRITAEHRERSPDLPWVDVVIVHTRGESPWVRKAIESVHAQSYANTRLLLINNNDRALTIGAAWNLGAQYGSAKWKLYMGDDDLLAPDLVSTLVCHAEAPLASHIVHSTSLCTLLDDHTGTMIPANVPHTGMFMRSYLLDNPFDELAPRHVGQLAAQALNNRSRLLGKPLTSLVAHSHGYVWRFHPTMVSGATLRQQA